MWYDVQWNILSVDFGLIVDCILNRNYIWLRFINSPHCHFIPPFHCISRTSRRWCLLSSFLRSSLFFLSCCASCFAGIQINVQTCMPAMLAYKSLASSCINFHQILYIYIYMYIYIYIYIYRDMNTKQIEYVCEENIYS